MAVEADGAEAGAYTAVLETTGDVAKDSDAVRKLCETMPAQALSIGGSGGFGLDLRFLDADTTKSCLVALSSSIRAQHGTMESMKRDVHEAMVASGAGGKDHLELESLRERLKEMESALTNLAQNVQGFSEEPVVEGEEEGAFAEEEPPPAVQEETEEERAARLALAADRAAAADAAADARAALEDAEAVRRAAEIEALEAKHEEARRATEEQHRQMSMQMEAMAKAMEQMTNEHERQEANKRLLMEKQMMMEAKLEGEKRLRESQARTSLIKGRFQSGLGKLSSQRLTRNQSFLADLRVPRVSPHVFARRAARQGAAAFAGTSSLRRGGSGASASGRSSGRTARRTTPWACSRAARSRATASRTG